MPKKGTMQQTPKTRKPREHNVAKAELSAERLALIRDTINDFTERECLVIAHYAVMRAKGKTQKIPLLAVVSSTVDGQTIQGAVVKRLGAGMLKCVTATGQVFTAPSSECKIIHQPS